MLSTKVTANRIEVLVVSLSVMLYTVTIRGSLTSLQERAAPSEIESWGQPVEGIELRLFVSKNVSSASPGLPGLEMQLRNRGGSMASFAPEPLSHLVNLEVDGVWYSPMGAAGSDPRTRTLQSGMTANVPVVFQTSLVELDAAGVSLPSNKLVLKPGRHTIRVRTPDTRGITIQDAAPRVVRVISNPVIVDVP
jgi:hypothetical protein